MTPLIVHLLGPNAYGLVGFYATLTLFLAFLDQAITPTVTRELARRAHQPDAAGSLRRLLRTLEALSGAMAVALGVLIAGLAPFIARYWLVNSGIPETELIDAIRLMGLALACQWPATLYGGGFVGLQRQDVLVAIRVTLVTVQSVGAVILLATVEASPPVFFAWMALTSAALSVLLRTMLWRLMPPASEPVRADLEVLREVWRFAVGNLLIGLTAALLTQSSGLIIAKYCSLDQLAAYTLAVTLASQISTILVQPISGTLMPHFTSLVAEKDSSRSAREYHRWSQLITAMVLPVTGTLYVFAQPLLQLWLGGASPLVAPVAELLPWIAIGTLFNTLVTPPYFLQIANGWTRLSVIKNVIALVFILPILVITVPRYGPLAAAVCWIALNLGYYLIEVPYMHRCLLKGELWAWWGRDTLAPMAVAAIVYGATLAIVPPEIDRFDGLAMAIVVAILTWAILLVTLPFYRADVFGALRLLKLRLSKIG